MNEYARVQICDISMEHDEEVEAIADALSSPLRRRIIRMVCKKPYSVDQIANELNIPDSTASFNIKILKKANIIKVVPSPNKKGNEKSISINIGRFSLLFGESIKKKEIEHKKFDIPIGSFIEHEICSPCVVSLPNYGPLSPNDDPSIFNHPMRIKAQHISFLKGYLVYPIPMADIRGQPVSLSLILELCSEAPFYDDHWRSDISIKINDVELFVYKSYGDYGGRDGFSANLATFPAVPQNIGTTYGMPLSINVNREGTFLNGKLVSEVKIDDLNLQKDLIAKLKIGVDKNASHVGGVNIFGKETGDFSTGILVDIGYKAID